MPITVKVDMALSLLDILYIFFFLSLNVIDVLINLRCLMPFFPPPRLESHSEKPFTHAMLASPCVGISLRLERHMPPPLSFQLTVQIPIYFVGHVHRTVCIIDN